MAITNSTSTNTTASAKKPTKAMRFAELLNLTQVQEKPELVEFINHEIDLLSRKNSGEKKPTKTQAENEVLKDAIFDGMEDNRAYTVTELIKEIPEIGELTNQKVSALMRGLVAEHRVERKEDKRKAVFIKVMEG